jgi:hypothetical protein
MPVGGVVQALLETGHDQFIGFAAMLRSPLPVRTLRQSREAAALSEARTCYDHLAGRAGVGLLEAMLQGLADTFGLDLT